MSQTDVPFTEYYNRVIHKLAYIENNPVLSRSHPDDRIFADDVALRLKLWVADISDDQESFAWAGNIAQISDQLSERLTELDRQCELFNDALLSELQSEIIEPLCRSFQINIFSPESREQLQEQEDGTEKTTSSARKSLQQAVDNLVALSPLIKIAAAVPKSDRTSETLSRAVPDSDTRREPITTKGEPYILLQDALPLDHINQLLGAVVVPKELMSNISRGTQLVSIPPDTSNMKMEKSAIKALDVVGLTNQASRSPIHRNVTALTLGASKSSTGAGFLVINKWQLAEAEDYLAWFTKAHEKKLKEIFQESPHRDLALVSVLISAQIPSAEGSSPADGNEQGPGLQSSAVDAIDQLANGIEQVIAFGCLEIPKPRFGTPRFKAKGSSPKPLYFLMPEFTIPPPPDGPIQLGSIIEEIASVQRPINGTSLGGVGPVDSTTEQKMNYRFETSYDDSSDFRSFLRQWGLGIDADRRLRKIVMIDCLETIQFSPTMDFIHQCLGQDEVKQRLKGRLYKSLYMITGMKIARGAGVSRTERETSAGADILGGLGVSAGMSAVQEVTASTAFGTSSDCIVAVRLRRIKFRRRLLSRKPGELIVEDYTNGAFL